MYLTFVHTKTVFSWVNWPINAIIVHNVACDYHLILFSIE